MSGSNSSPLAAPQAPAPKVESLSVSKINQYLRCPAAYYFRHIRGLRAPTRSYQMLGNALHSGIEFSYRKKISSHQDLPLKDVKEFYSASFDYLKGKTLWEPKENPGKLKDEGVRLLEVYQSQVAPTVQPEAVEDIFEVKFENVDYAFKGIIDLVDGATGFVVDHKTSSKTPSPDNVHKDLQLTAYAMGHRVKFGKKEKGLRFDYLVRAKEPRIVRIETSRSDEDIQRFLKLLAHVAAAIKEGRFYPNPTSLFCNPKLCSYWDMCEGGRKW